MTVALLHKIPGTQADCPLELVMLGTEMQKDDFRCPACGFTLKVRNTKDTEKK